MVVSKDLYKLKVQVSVLKEVSEQYKTCTIANAIQQIENRIKYLESNAGD